MIAKIVGNGDTTPLGLAAIIGAFLAPENTYRFFGRSTKNLSKGRGS